jgi:hypothetical protein
MIAAQLIAAHNATMECYRRAMIGEQTLEARTPSISPTSIRPKCSSPPIPGPLRVERCR